MRKRNDVEKQRGKGHYHAEIANVDGKIMAIISRVDYREMDPYGSHYYDMEETKRIPFKSRKAARKYLKTLGFEFEKTIFDTKKKDWLSKSLRKRKVSRKTRARNQPLKLTMDQIREVQAEMVPNGVPVRFLKDGRCLNIETGELQPKGINVMYQITYWNFKRSTAYKIVKWLGVKAKFDAE